VICDGCVAESGKHDELRAAQGIYAKLYETQFGLDEAERVLGGSTDASAVQSGPAR